MHAVLCESQISALWTTTCGVRVLTQLRLCVVLEGGMQCFVNHITSCDTHQAHVCLPSSASV